MAERIGRYTLRLNSSPTILSFAAAGSHKEREGPLGNFFDIICPDSSFGQKTWEKAEIAMQKTVIRKALVEARISAQQIQYLFAGDLMNQCIVSSYTARENHIPFLGLYGACSTMAESLMLASLFVEGGLGERCLAVTSSHFCSAERQFRLPLEYGGQRPPSSQWTVTGAGACVVVPRRSPPYVREVTAGTVEDLGIRDISNMGAAMAPAACSVLCHYFEDTGHRPEDFDLILTGDLGMVGSLLLYELLEQQDISIRDNHKDCGLLIYDREKQDVHAGGSGCGCSAAVLCGYILPQIQSGQLHDVLFLATGALMSPTSVQQGETIPGIAHLLHLSHTPFDWKEELQ